MNSNNNNPHDEARRRFLKQCFIGGCGAALGAYTWWDLFVEGGNSGLRVGFHNDSPEHLDAMAQEARYYKKVVINGKTCVHCQLCPHQCILSDNDRGFCRTRVVKNQTLYTLAYGNPCAVHIDPVEKKPLNHFLPGTMTLSLATAGCNLRCLNCQNWDISQSRPEDSSAQVLPPEKLVQTALSQNTPSLSYTYSDPIAFYEYAYDTSLKARENNLRNILVTAGYFQPQPLKDLCRLIDAAHVDLKSFNDDFYKKVCGATLKPVLQSLEILRQQGVWVEIIRLVVPKLSDDLNDIGRMCRWIVQNLGPDVPLHLSRFYPAYKLSMLPPTSVKKLSQAQQIAQAEGLHYVYIGNVPQLSQQNTVCPSCRGVVLERNGYQVVSNRIREGKCGCGYAIAGVWS